MSSSSQSANLIVLRDGDVVLIEARQKELYYTGGLLPSGTLAFADLHVGVDGVALGRIDERSHLHRRRH